jgi:hypothetical protein
VHLDGDDSAPAIDWERVKRMPHDLPAQPAEGAYRSTVGKRAPVIVARRATLTVVEAFFDWLVSTTAFPFKEQPLSIVVTEEDVYARFRDGTVGRLPRSALRARFEIRRAGTVYVFGRAARLLVPAGAAGAAVAGVLDSQLRQN